MACCHETAFFFFPGLSVSLSGLHVFIRLVARLLRPNNAQICSPLSWASGEILFHLVQVCLTSMATDLCSPKRPVGLESHKNSKPTLNQLLRRLWESFFFSNHSKVISEITRWKLRPCLGEALIWGFTRIAKHCVEHLNWRIFLFL